MSRKNEAEQNPAEAEEKTHFYPRLTPTVFCEGGQISK